MSDFLMQYNVSFIKKIYETVSRKISNIMTEK